LDIDLTIDKIDLSDLQVKKDVLIKNINVFINEMTNFKLQPELDWKSVAKEMEIVWCAYTRDITNCEKE